MSKRRKRKPPVLKQDPRIRFDLEEDALELFKQHIDSIAGVKNEEDQLDQKPRKRLESITVRQLDLHGFRAEAALKRTKEFTQACIRQHPDGVRIRFITGRGRHSGPDGGVLTSLVHQYVASHFKEFIVKIDSDPSKEIIGELPIKGFFEAIFKLK